MTNGIFGEARVLRRVFHDQHLVVENGVAAEGDVARPFRHRQVAASLQEIPIRIHEGDERDRRVELAPGDRRDPVELRLRIRVEDAVFTKRRKALFLIHRMRGRFVHDIALPHRASPRTLDNAITFGKSNRLQGSRNCDRTW